MIASLLWSSLQVLNRERFEALIKVFGTLDDAAMHIDGELLCGLGCRAATVTNALQRLDKYDPDEEEALFAASGATLIAFSDPQYPDRLRDLPDAPVFLYARGDIALLPQPGIALVGTRRMSSYGRRVTSEYTKAVTRAGMVTVSGLARGVDSVVAQETMDAHGKTIAVLGQGLSTLPSLSKEFADRIVSAGGLILSEFPLRYAADLFTFPMRNRIIAGLSIATVVLEAPESSGALITAKLAFDYGREVFAVPGTVFDSNYAGCHLLIQKNQARLTSTPSDLLPELGIVPADDADISSYAAETAEEKSLLDALNRMPQSVDVLTEKTQLEPGGIIAMLTIFELNGAAKNLGGGLWIRG